MATDRKPLRIFLGFHDIALYQSELKRGLEDLGCYVTRIALGSDELKFGSDDSGRAVCFRWLKRAIEWNRVCWQKVDQTPKTEISRLFIAVWVQRISALVKKAFQWVALLWTIARHDVIVLSYAGSFLEPSDHTMEPVFRRFLDLKLIKRCGRKLILTFHGSDSRPPYLDGYVVRNPRKLSPESMVELTRSRRRMIEGLEQYADEIVSVPAQSYFHRRRIVLHEFLGRPFEARDEMKRPGQKEKRQLVVLHAPSNPHAKGSDELRKSMHELKQRREDFDFVEIVRRPHAELVEALQSADVVVDQVYSDRMITGVATEAMYFGVPVVLGGYYAEYYRQDYCGRVPLPPLIFCRPEEVAQKVAELLDNAEQREELGRLGREYVRTHYAPRKVASRWLTMIAGHLPPEAYYNPADLRYPYGCALSLLQLRESVASVLREAGREALCLSDKPELAAAVAAIAE